MKGLKLISLSSGAAAQTSKKRRVSLARGGDWRGSDLLEAPHVKPGGCREGSFKACQRYSSVN